MTTALGESKLLAKEESRTFLAEMCKRLGTDPEALWRVVKRTCIQPDKNGREATDEEIVLYLLVCNIHELNPLLKEAYAFLSKGRLQIGVGIDGWLKIANRHPQFDGLQVVDEHDEHGQLVSCTATVWRKDRKMAAVLTEYLAECQQETYEWQRRPHRFLRHKTAIQAIRYAFGLGGIADPDEAREAVDLIDADYEVADEPPSTLDGVRAHVGLPPASTGADESAADEPGEIDGADADVIAGEDEPGADAGLPEADAPETERYDLLARLGALCDESPEAAQAGLAYYNTSMRELERESTSIDMLREALKKVEVEVSK